jgi:CheY-like chemotaxis protein
VVDDNLDAAETLAMLLQLMHYEVRTASNGRECVEIASGWHPHLILLDINMPVMNGYEAARALRRCVPAATPAPVLVALTARSTAQDECAASAAGFDLHLVKPVDGRELTDLIARVLAQARTES